MRRRLMLLCCAGGGTVTIAQQRSSACTTSPTVRWFDGSIAWCDGGLQIGPAARARCMHRGPASALAWLSHALCGALWSGDAPPRLREGIRQSLDVPALSA